ncbi:unnamed protein product [Prunus brigantina]
MAATPSSYSIPLSLYICNQITSYHCPFLQLCQSKLFSSTNNTVKKTQIPFQFVYNVHSNLLNPATTHILSLHPQPLFPTRYHHPFFFSSLQPQTAPDSSHLHI